LSKDKVLPGQIVTNLFRCSNLLERISRGRLTEAGLTSVHQWMILSALSEGDLSLKKLIQNANVTKQNMTGMVERLKLCGLVTTFEDPADRRVTLVRLSPEGARTLGKLNSFEAYCKDTNFKQLGEEDLRSLNRCLLQMIDNMKDA